MANAEVIQILRETIQNQDREGLLGRFRQLHPADAEIGRASCRERV